MKIVVRVAALAAVLAVSYGGAAVLPGGIEPAVGYVTLAVIVIGAFWWAMRDGREFDLSEIVRDWLVVAAVGAVLWRVSLVMFEGTEDVVDQIRLEFASVLYTIGYIFVPALFGALLGRGSSPTRST